MDVYQSRGQAGATLAENKNGQNHRCLARNRHAMSPQLRENPMPGTRGGAISQLRANIFLLQNS